MICILLKYYTRNVNMNVQWLQLPNFQTQNNPRVVHMLLISIKERTGNSVSNDENYSGEYGLVECNGQRARLPEFHSQ